MKKIAFLSKTIFPAIISLIFFFNSLVLSKPKLSEKKLILLKVVTSIHFTFEQCAKTIWPGYDLSSQPYIAYWPQAFVLYLNGRRAPAQFEPYPEDWPALPNRAFIHYGGYDDLVGQFASNVCIDSVVTFAMGLPETLLFSAERPAFMLLGSTIHEGFHQFQHDHFGEIPWAREEWYPILSVPNTALASLEMHILRQAITAMFNGQHQRLKNLARQFVAVREYRWRQAPPFVKKYEQGQEINEGTARYVEMKAMECFLNLDTTRIQNDLFKELKNELSGMTIEQLLLNDMYDRLSGLAVAPGDMPRNRIYPVGAALGFLLDRLGIDWKMKFQAAGSRVSFSGLLKQFFKMDSATFPQLLSQARAEFHYAKIEQAARQLTEHYLSEYRQALEKFNQQQGLCVEVEVSSNGLQRFRSTKDKKWLVENGKKQLALHYNLYALKSLTGSRFELELKDCAVFEQNDWKKRRKKVIFYCADSPTVLADTVRIDLQTSVEKRFQTLRLNGARLKLQAEQSGKIVLKKNTLRIVLN